VCSDQSFSSTSTGRICGGFSESAKRDVLEHTIGDNYDSLPLDLSGDWIEDQGAKLTLDTRELLSPLEPM
jgi:hypothetical protein